MSLPTPLDVLKEARRIAKEGFFLFVMFILILPVAQWGFVGVGVLVILLHHWIVGGILVFIGLAGWQIGANIKI